MLKILCLFEEVESEYKLIINLSYFDLGIFKDLFGKRVLFVVVVGCGLILL